MAATTEEKDNLMSEISLMRGLSHPNIVEYIGAKVDETQGKIFIFQEWIPGWWSEVK